MTARYKGDCYYSHLSECKGITKGDRIIYAGRGQVWHPGCGPTGVDSRADNEYMQGRVEAQEARWLRNTFGEAAAIDYELRMDAIHGDY